MMLYLIHLDNRFKDVAVAFLDKLTHGVQIRGEINRGRIDAFEILAFAFAVQLLPPFGYKMQGRLVVD
ncbi:hypothetical protein D3C75_1333600 [compost metagenome]